MPLKTAGSPSSAASPMAIAAFFHLRAVSHGITNKIGDTFMDAAAPTASGPHRRGMPRTSAAVISGWMLALQTAKNVRGPMSRMRPGDRRAGHRGTAQPARQRANQAVAPAGLGGDVRGG